MIKKSTNNFPSRVDLPLTTRKMTYYQPTPSGGVRLLGRYSTPLLLLCWREHFEKNVNIFKPKLDIFLELAPQKMN